MNLQKINLLLIVAVILFLAGKEARVEATAESESGDLSVHNLEVTGGITVLGGGGTRFLGTVLVCDYGVLTIDKGDGNCESGIDTGLRVRRFIP